MCLKKRNRFTSANSKTRLPTSQNSKKLRKEWNPLSLLKFGNQLIWWSDLLFWVSNLDSLLRLERFSKNPSNNFPNICCFLSVWPNHRAETSCWMKFCPLLCHFSWAITLIHQLFFRNCLKATKVYSSEESVSCASMTREWWICPEFLISPRRWEIVSFLLSIATIIHLLST